MFQTCSVCMLYASVRSVTVFTCRCTDCIKYCVLGKLLSIATLEKSSCPFVSQDEAHEKSLVHWLQIATFSVKSCTFVESLPHLAPILSNRGPAHLQNLVNAHVRPKCLHRSPSNTCSILERTNRTGRA